MVSVSPKAVRTCRPKDLRRDLCVVCAMTVRFEDWRPNIFRNIPDFRRPVRKARKMSRWARMFGQEKMIGRSNPELAPGIERCAQDTVGGEAISRAKDFDFVRSR